jgi:hypothetical protein
MNTNGNLRLDVPLEDDHWFRLVPLEAESWFHLVLLEAETDL